MISSSPKSSIEVKSKLPNVGTTIFTVMSALANKESAINLSQGFPDFDVSKPLIDLVGQHMSAGHNQYAPMAGIPKLLDAIAQKVENSYGWELNETEEITVTAGGTQGLFTAIAALVNNGDEVIVFDPSYDSYAPSIVLAGGKPIHLQLIHPKFNIDWQEFKDAITDKTSMVIINSPHNPTGATLTEDDLKTLAQIIASTNIVVLSDEVYEHICFDDHLHQSILRFPELASRSMAIFSFGKTFHATGWKMGYTVAPSYLMKEFRKVHQFNVFSANTPVQYALADYISEKDNYQNLPSFYQAKRDLFLDLMTTSRFKMLPSKGTYFQLADYSAISAENDVAFAKRVTAEHKVASIPVSVFYENKQDNKVVRFCFAKSEETLVNATKLLCKI